MNKNLTIGFLTGLFCLIYTTPLMAQHSRKSAWRAESAATYSYLEELAIQWHLQRSFGPHVVFGGLSAPLNHDHVTDAGFSGGYQLYLNRESLTFDLFLRYQGALSGRKLSSYSMVKGTSLRQSLGYGFDIRIKEGLVLFHYLGIGLEHSWFKGYDTYRDLHMVMAFGLILNIKTVSLD